MSRFFAFGCSFTRYTWPTWADIIATNFDEYYNYGQTGGGNLYIACSIGEAIITHNINSDDTVIVMWSNVAREDRYIDMWATPGNIYNQTMYPRPFVKNFVRIKGCYVRDMALINLADQSLQNTGCDYKFTSMIDMNMPNQYTLDDVADELSVIMELYKPLLDKFQPSAHKTIFNYDFESRKIYARETFRTDKHPLPLEHLEYVQKIFPEYKVSDDYVKFLGEQDMKIRESFEKTGKYYDRNYEKRNLPNRL